MGRIVLDTNCLIQSIPPRSKYHAVWNSLVTGNNILCISNEILEEYIEILQRLASLEVAEYVAKVIINSPFTKMVSPYYHFQLIESDPDDNKFVDCAIAANAKYIVTNDHHYDILHQTDFPAINIVTLDKFMEYIAK